MYPDNDLNPAEYAIELAKHQGVSVASVSDGWIFSFTAETLQALLDKAKETGMAIVFVKSTQEVSVKEQN